MDDIEAAWGLLEEEIKKAKEQNNTNGTPQNGTSNETQVSGNGVKRKLEDNSDEKQEELTDETQRPTKKRKVSEEETKTNGFHNIEDTDSSLVLKFNWSSTIKDILLSRNNQLKLIKLKKKVFKKYKTYTGKAEISDKIERKFNKKLNKLGLLIKDDTVQLIQ